MPVTKGKPKPQFSKEERISIAQQVCDLYASQNATLASCCDAAGVGESTFRMWAVQNSEIGEMYKKARLRQDETFFEERIRPLAKRGLERLLEGEILEESRRSNVIIDGKEIEDVFQVTKVRKETGPNPTAVIFAMKGEFPDKYADRSKIETDVNFSAAVVTDKDAEKLLAVLNQISQAKTD